MEPLKNQEAINAYLNPPEGIKKGQLVIKNNKVLELRELTHLESLGKKIGLGPAAATKVLHFINQSNFGVSNQAKLERKLQKHTIRGFLANLFTKHTKSAPAPTEPTTPSYKLTPQTISDAQCLEGYLLTMTVTTDGTIECLAKKDSIDIQVPEQISKAVNDFAKKGPQDGEENFNRRIFSIFSMQMRFYSKTELKIGDEIPFSQTQRKQKYFPDIQDVACTVTNVQYDNDKNDTVYTFKRIVNPGTGTTEVWSETQTQLHTPVKPIQNRK